MTVYVRIDEHRGAAGVPPREWSYNVAIVMLIVAAIVIPVASGLFVGFG